MTSLRAMCVIQIIVAGQLLIAGCVGQDGQRKNVGNVPSTVFITPLIPTPSQNTQKGHWMNADPISDKRVADILGGKTNWRTSVVNQNLPDLYTAPIGGYEVTVVTLESNKTFETNYTFYSRNWGPGEVNYSLSAWSYNWSPINQRYESHSYPIDQAKFTIEPSTFIAEPDHSYTSKVTLVPDSLPQEFFTGVDVGVMSYSPVNLNIRVHLGNNSTQYADDQVSFKTRLGGPYSLDYLSTDNCSIRIESGEKKQLNISYQYYFDRGPGKINLSTAPTPLNITFTPSDFIVKHGIEFPVVFTISAGSYVSPGEYPLEFLINGNTRPQVIKCRGTNTYSRIGMPFINVTVVEKNRFSL
jgi:hypothetical protein